MDLSQFGSMMAVGALLGLIGRLVNSAVFRGRRKATATGWRSWFYLTAGWHPVVAGALLGALASTLPAPEFLGSGLAGRVIWYALSGGFSHAIYRTVDTMFKQRAARNE